MAKPISLDPQQLEAWLDEFISKQMEELHIPGVTFSLVQNGQIVLAKGYGYANLEQQIPVSSDHTLFKVGSVSKLFTATAIMQLVEKGIIDLHTDVNKYLTEFQIPEEYSQPITIANLLTHTAGFDERLVGLFTRRAEDIPSLGQILAEKMPARALPPGKAMSYSNCGYALLGHIVESVTGVLFSQYVEKSILQPLEMNSSSFTQPSRLAPHVALGYKYNKYQNTYQAFPSQYMSITPAGSFSGTGTDMAKFAIAHLQYGRYKDSRILKESTSRQMQQRQFTNDPRLPGMGWGFMESLHNQQKAIGHGGGLPGFTSLLYLFPDHNLGFFVSDNGQAKLSEKLLEEFYDRFFPSQVLTSSEKSLVVNQESLKRYEGTYRNNRYARKTIGKICLLGTPSFELKLASGGKLFDSKTSKTSSPEYLCEVKPSFLQSYINGKKLIDSCFVAKEKQGEVKTLFSKMGVLEKIAWYETNSFHYLLIGLFILVFATGFGYGIWNLLQPSVIFVHRFTQILATTVCSLNLLIFIFILLLLPQLIYEASVKLFIFLCIPILSSILTIILSISTILALASSEYLLIEAIYYSIIMVISLGFIPFLNYWNLLGFRY